MPTVRVLLVDDNPAFLDAAAHFLREHPDVCVVGCLLSATEALEKVSTLQPDVVLMDLVMPQMNGLVAALHLRVLPRAPKVIIVSDHEEPAYRTLASAIQVDGFLPRRSFCAEVLPLIRRLTR